MTARSEIRRPGGARPQARSLWAVFAAPIGMGALSLLGLISALAGDGAADWLSWVTLAVPVLAVAWAMRCRRA